MAKLTLLQAWKAFSKLTSSMRLQQFGQLQDSSTFNGATGCTHTILQRLIKAKTGQTYSHDQISKIAGYPWPVNNPRMRGLMTPSEVQRVIDHFDLPYKLKTGLSWDEVIDATALGPVIIGIRYGYWPEQVGARYFGINADGKPGGYAFRNGKTQLKGAEGIYHAILVLGRKYVKGVWRTYANEPNHGSASRPERPDYDSVRSAHARRAYNQYGSDGRVLIAWIPTRLFRPKGF